MNISFKLSDCINHEYDDRAIVNIIKNSNFIFELKVTDSENTTKIIKISLEQAVDLKNQIDKSIFDFRMIDALSGTLNDLI